MPNPKRRHSKGRRDRRRAHDHLRGARPQRLPQLPRAQAAAPGVPEVRALQGQGGRRGRGGLGVKQPRVAVDAMGGDHGPAEVVEGAVLASREHGVAVSLVGPERVLRDELERLGATSAVEVVDAPEAVGMGEKVSLSTLKRRSSIQVALERVRDGRADAFFSGGNTAACWTIAKMVLGTLEVVDRPALAAVFPNRHGTHGPPRRGRQRAVQGAPARGVRRHGQRLRARGARLRAAPRRAHEHGRGGDEGQRARPGGPRGAEGLEPELRGQRRGSRPVHRQGGRGGDGRLHRQRGAQGLRDARRARGRPHPRGGGDATCAGRSGPSSSSPPFAPRGGAATRPRSAGRPSSASRAAA